MYGNSHPPEDDRGPLYSVVSVEFPKTKSLCPSRSIIASPAIVVAQEIHTRVAAGFSARTKTRLVSLLISVLTTDRGPASSNHPTTPPQGVQPWVVNRIMMTVFSLRNTLTGDGCAKRRMPARTARKS